MIHDVGIVPLIVFVHYDGAINPHGKLIQKVALFVVQRIVGIEVDDGFGSIFAKGQFLSLLSVFQ